MIKAAGGEGRGEGDMIEFRGGATSGPPGPPGPLLGRSCGFLLPLLSARGALLLVQGSLFSVRFLLCARGSWGFYRAAGNSFGVVRARPKMLKIIVWHFHHLKPRRASRGSMSPCSTLLCVWEIARKFHPCTELSIPMLSLRSNALMCHRARSQASCKHTE